MAPGDFVEQQPRDEGEVLNVAVVPRCRDQGIGRQLLEALVKNMAVEGAKSVFLEVRASNVSARSLYAQLGFEIVGLRVGYYADPTENAVQMRLISRL